MERGATLLHSDIYTDTGGRKGEEPSNVAAHLIFASLEAGLHIRRSRTRLLACSEKGAAKEPPPSSFPSLARPSGSGQRTPRGLLRAPVTPQSQPDLTGSNRA